MKQFSIDRSIAYYIKKTLESQSKKICVYFKHKDSGIEEISCADFYRRAIAYSSIFKNCGVKKGEIVLIITDHSPHILYAFIGALLAGVIPSILPFPGGKISKERYSEIFKNLFKIIEPVCIVCQKSKLSEYIQSDRITLADIDDEEIFNDSNGFKFAEDILKREDIAFLQHSSGTTGLQKGVALTNASVLNHMNAYGKILGLNEKDLIVSWLPLYHDMGLVSCFVMPLLFGIPFVMMSPFEWIANPVSILELVSKYKGTLMWLPNFSFNILGQFVKPELRNGLNLGSLRAIINCSEPVMQDSMLKFYDFFQTCGLKKEALSACYAMAENTFAVSQTPMNKFPEFICVSKKDFYGGNRIVLIDKSENSNEEKILISSGVPLENCEVRIIGKNNEILDDGLIGEIIIKSNCMLKEYFKRELETSNAIIDGYYHTGDIGFIQNNNLYITGRKKDIIIASGQNFYPNDIENVINEVFGVRKGRVCVFGVYNELLGTEEIIALAELEKNSDNREKIEIIKLIKHSVFNQIGCQIKKILFTGRDSLIKSTSGKISRSHNKKKYIEGAWN